MVITITKITMQSTVERLLLVILTMSNSKNNNNIGMYVHFGTIPPWKGKRTISKNNRGKKHRELLRPYPSNFVWTA